MSGHRPCWVTGLAAPRPLSPSPGPDRPSLVLACVRLWHPCLLSLLGSLLLPCMALPQAPLRPRQVRQDGADSSSERRPLLLVPAGRVLSGPGGARARPGWLLMAIGSRRPGSRRPLWPAQLRCTCTMTAAGESRGLTRTLKVPAHVPVGFRWSWGLSRQRRWACPDSPRG